MALFQEVLVDSLTARLDSAVSADGEGGLAGLTREVGEASRALATGQWDRFTAVAYDQIATRLVDFVPSLLSALLIFLFLYVVYRVGGSILRRLMERSRRVDRGLQELVIKTYRIAALTIIAVMVLDQFGFQITTLLAGIGIVGIAVGFAARDTLENFISGVTVLIDRPFRVGDYIEIEGQYGSVQEITLRSTRIRTLNNELLVMPNVQMINQKLVNHTMLGVIRVEVPFGIAYKEYPQEARDVVLETTRGDDRLHPGYPCDVVVAGLGDSSVDMILRLHILNPDFEVPIRFEYIEKVREALRRADIEIPFPHRQLFIDEAKAFARSPLLGQTGPDDAPQA